jgi:hypothetical protein
VFKRKLAVVAVAASLLIGLPSAAAAFTSYADPAIEVQVNPTSLFGGTSFGGYATSNVECNWTVTFRGETRTDFGTRIDFEFETPEVSETTYRDVDVTCSYDDTTLESLESPTSSTGVRNANYVVNTSTALPAAIQELERAVRIRILSRSSDDDDDDDGDGDGDTSSSGLPGTGGVNAGWIYGGAALLLVGSATVIVSRRRSEPNA